MKRHRHYVAGFCIFPNHMAAFLTGQHKTVFLWNSCDTLCVKRTHYRTETSISSMIGRELRLGTASFCEFNSSIQSSNTSAPICLASSKVFPKVRQPGKSGKETLYPPSIAGSKTAKYEFILSNLRDMSLF